MNEKPCCARCGTRLVEPGLAGNCPHCLLALALPAAAEGVSVSARPEDPAPRLPAGAPCPAPKAPWLFGDYELLEEIARGGMGVVYRARHVRLNRTVAVKVLPFGPFASDEFVRRFRAEAEIAANLHHPNIVAIHEIGEHDGRPYFSMDYVDGGHLGNLVQERPLAARRAAALLETIAEAVHHAHQRGVLHRDLKPSNVLIDSAGHPRLTDFGLAKRLAPDPASPRELTLTGQMLGTPEYTSPEQAGGNPRGVTVASDVHALGAILYFLLTGRPPFRGDSPEATLHQVLDREPASPRLSNASVPRDLETICLKCLAKEPSARYGTARELAEELHRFLDHRPILARPARLPEKLSRWCRRRPALAALIAALHLVGAAGLTGIVVQWRRAEHHAEAARRLADLETAQRVRAEESLTLLELQRAEDLLEKSDVVRGIALLARLVRQRPDHAVAATRLLSALTQRDFVLPVGTPSRHEKKVNHAEFSPDGRHVVTASLDATVRLWDARTGEPVGEPFRHPQAVRGVRFSPDGRRLVTVSDDPAAWLWETAVHRPRGLPLRHEQQVRSARFSPDGRQVVTASDDRTVRLWDAADGTPLLPPLSHAEPVSGALVSPDGRWLASISRDHATRLWDARDGSLVGQPMRHDAEVNTAQFSPDSHLLVTASEDGTARVWATATAQLLGHPLPHADRVTGAEFSPDGTRLATTSHDRTARLWETRTGKLLSTLPHGFVVHLARFSPDGQRLLTGWPDNAMRLWDARTSRMLATPFQHDGLIWSAQFSPDGQFVVTAAADRTARLWDIRPGRATALALPHPGRVITAGFSPDGAGIASAADDGTVRIWDRSTGRPLTPPLRHRDLVRAARFDAAGRRLLTASDDGTARLWDARTGKPLTEPLPCGGRAEHAEFSPDRNWFLTVAPNRSLRLWEVASGTLRRELTRRDDLGPFAHFGPDSQTVIFGLSRDDSARLVELASGRTRTEFRGHGGYVTCAAFRADGGRIVTGSEDGTARIWDAATGAPVTPALFHTALVSHAEFSPDGTKVVTASGDATARVWDAANGRTLTEPLRHRGLIYQARFSPEGRQVLTASVDGTVRLWDAQTGRPVSEPLAHDGVVGRVEFSPDGLWAVTASHDGTARLWELPPRLPVGGELTLLLADLAEGVIGRHLGSNGTLEPVSSPRLVALRRQTHPLASTNALARWIEWFLADRSTRTLSPNSEITVPQYVTWLGEQRTLPAAREAALLAPSDAPTLAHVAEVLLAQPTPPDPDSRTEAAFLIRRAETLAPGDARVAEIRARLERQLRP